MLNINLGRNMELMEKCRRLAEYSIFVSTVRKYAKTDNLELGEAILQEINSKNFDALSDNALTQIEDRKWVYWHKNFCH